MGFRGGFDEFEAALEVDLALADGAVLVRHGLQFGDAALAGEHVIAGDEDHGGHRAHTDEAFCAAFASCSDYGFVLL